MTDSCGRAKKKRWEKEWIRNLINGKEMPSTMRHFSVVSYWFISHTATWSRQTDWLVREKKWRRERENSRKEERGRERKRRAKQLFFLALTRSWLVVPSSLDSSSTTATLTTNFQPFITAYDLKVPDMSSEMTDFDEVNKRMIPINSNNNHYSVSRCGRT